MEDLTTGHTNVFDEYQYMLDFASSNSLAQANHPVETTKPIPPMIPSDRPQQFQDDASATPSYEKSRLAASITMERNCVVGGTSQTSNGDTTATLEMIGKQRRCL
jgi:hypothetical protein